MPPKDHTPAAAPIPFDDLLEFFSNEGRYGQCCDILVAGPDYDAWAGVLAHVASACRYTYTLGFNPDDPPRPIPADVREALGDLNAGPWPSLSLDVLGMSASFIAMCPTWIELSFSRSEVTRERYLALADLMRGFGDSASRDVFMTPDSTPHDGVIAYDHAVRRHRRPRHGRSSDGAVRSLVFARVRAALEPVVRAASPRWRAPDVPDDVLIASLRQLEGAWEGFTELHLQDEMSVRDLELMDELWSMLASIVEPPAGVRPPRDKERTRRIQELARLAADLA